MAIHLFFDILAALAATAVTVAVYRWRIAGSASDPTGEISKNYLAAMIAGAVSGAYIFGTLALWLDGFGGIGRSIVGSLAGAIVAIEIYKSRVGIRRSTGLTFVAGFCATVVVGRIGCLLSGLADRTYGVPTGAAWGWDFGDGIPRHPVQLYESVTMLLFLSVALRAFALRQPFFLRNGFYLLVAVYALQRFAWEFLKPSAALLGPLNLFHLLCLLLIVYSIRMITTSSRAQI